MYSSNVQPNQLNRDDDDGISKRAEEEESERERERGGMQTKGSNYGSTTRAVNCRLTVEKLNNNKS